MSVYPFLVHAFVISAICSVVGPFGGFLASGFKRACKRKARLSSNLGPIPSSWFFSFTKPTTFSPKLAQNLKTNHAFYRTLAPSSPAMAE